METLIAYHGDPKIKEKYLARVRAHRKANEITKDQYWENGKGNSVGCTIHSSEYLRYEIELGIPKELARVEDKLFELRVDDSVMLWPERFLSAVPVRANLHTVYWQFMQWLLVDEREGVIRLAKREQSKAVIEKMGALYARLIAGEPVEYEDWEIAAGDILSASNAASYDADWAASNAIATAWAASGAHVHTVDAIHAAANAASYAEVDHAFATDDVVYAAYSQALARQSEKLLELLRDTPVGI